MQFELKSNRLCNTTKIVAVVMLTKRKGGKMQDFVLVSGKIEELISPQLQAKWREKGLHLLNILDQTSLNIVKTKAPALVIAELNRDEISGWEVLDYIVHHHPQKKIPFIFVTSSPNEEEKHKALSLGVETYLSKPVDQEVLQKKAMEAFSSLGEKTEKGSRSVIKSITSRISEKITKKKNLAGSGTRQIKLATGIADTLHMRLSHLYSEETKLTQTKQPVSSDIFQRLLISFSLITVDRLNKISQEQVQRKLKGEEVTLEDILIEKGILTQEALNNLKHLKNEKGESLIPGYTIEKLLGEGGIAAVYRGRMDDTGQKVAIKIFAPPLSDTSSGVVRFIRECEAIKSLNHPNIVKAYDFGDFYGLYYMVMEFIEGVTLTEYILKKGMLQEQEALKILESLVDGLQDAWKKGFIHRDIKPDNVMVGEKGIKLFDFGLAKSLDTGMDLTRAGVIVGTPHYMAPEQFTGEEFDYRTDVYALGVTLYVMLTGHLPFAGKTTMALQDAHLASPPPPPSAFDIEISKACEAFVYKLLSKKKEDRCVSVDQLLENIKRVKKGLYPLGGVKYLQLQRRRRILKAGILGSIVVFIAGSIWYAVSAKQTAELKKKTAKVHYKKKIEEQKKKTEEETRALERRYQEQKKIIEEQKKKLLEEEKKRRLAEEISKKKAAILKQRIINLGLRQIRKAMNKLNLDYAMQEVSKLEYQYPLEPKIVALKKIVKNLYTVKEALEQKNIEKIWTKVKYLDKKEEYNPLLYLLLQSYYVSFTPKYKQIFFSKWFELSDKAKKYLMVSIRNDLSAPWMRKYFYLLPEKKIRLYFLELQKKGDQLHKIFVDNMQKLRLFAHLIKHITSSSKQLEDFVKKHLRFAGKNIDFVYDSLTREEKLTLCRMVPKLARRGYLKSLTVLIEKLDQDEEVSLRIFLAKNLCAAKHTLCDSALAKMLSDSELRIRSQAIDFLAKRRLFHFLNVVPKDQSPFIREKLIQVLKRLGKSNSTEILLIKMLEDPNEEIRKKAVKILGEWKSQIALTALHKRLWDEKSEVVHKTVWALGQLKDPSSVSPLLKTIQTSPEPEVHIEIIKTLGKIHSKSSSRALLQILKRYPFYKQTSSILASRGLEALPVVLEAYKKSHRLLYKRELENILLKMGPKIIPRLSFELLSTEDIALQKALIQLLGSLGEKSAVPILIKLLKKKTVKWYAKRALRQITENLPKSSRLRKKIEDILES
ncbi:MAG: response regulator [Planctomycetota bacterium]|nr:MAG: response regulator [Planctomycetota bacterium]